MLHGKNADKRAIWLDNYCYFKYLDGQAKENGVDPDQMPQNVASDQGLHCLVLIKQQQVVKRTCSILEEW